MIPAIILGFDEANRQFQNFQHGESVSDTYTIYKNLDSIYRKQNLNRTNGLLVGPLSSKIIAEGMMARIDKELCNAGLNYSRYVDDYEIYIRFLYNGIIIKHQKTEPTYTKTSLFLCEKRRFLWLGERKEWCRLYILKRKGGNLFKVAGPCGLTFFISKRRFCEWRMTS